MDATELTGILEFLRSAEPLKSTHRSGRTASGEPESVAAHSWRLCLMALLLADEFAPIDVARLLKICIVHDLGETLGGDIPATAQDPMAPKTDAERRDLLMLLKPLPPARRTAILELWDEYEAGTSPESRVAKALDKLETIMQHNQGANADSFDYEFNLSYGTAYTGDHPLVRRIRSELDEETTARAAMTRPATPLLYSSLAELWPSYSPPSEYVEEVATFRTRLVRHGLADGATILHLGSGGGSVDHNLKQHYCVTGVEISADMIVQAQHANAEVEYIQGDIRNVRLGRTFDAVLVHDAISYMTSVSELEMVYRTAAAHLEPGGIMIALPEELRERLSHLEPAVEVRVRGDMVLTVLETHYDADPTDNVHEAVYVFLIHNGNDLRVEVDRHRVGVFELDDFLGAIRRAGFAATADRWELSDWDGGPELPLIVATRT